MTMPLVPSYADMLHISAAIDIGLVNLHYIDMLKVETVNCPFDLCIGSDAPGNSESPESGTNWQWSHRQGQ